MEQVAGESFFFDRTQHGYADSAIWDIIQSDFNRAVSHSRTLPGGYCERLCADEEPWHVAQREGQLVRTHVLIVNRLEGPCVGAAVHVDFELFTPSRALQQRVSIV